MKNRRNYYRILHVQPDAPTSVIKASYRALMQRLKMHPDLGGDHAQAVLINEALATLTDPARRAAYDRTLGRAVERQRGSSRPAPPKDAPAASAPPPPPREAPTASAPPPPRGMAACSFCGAVSLMNDTDRAEGACATCGSALFPARKLQAEDRSRRAIERVPRNMPVTFRLSQSRETVWPGVTEDVSLSGMRFLSQVNIAIGERLRIECDFCSAVAIVRSVRPEAGHAGSRWQCGVEFLTLRIKRERGGLFSTVA